LIRGPAGSILESPSALLNEAYRQNRVVEFDWIARASASRAALACRLAPDDLLFLNIEPVALASTCPPDLRPDIEEAFGKFRIVLEVTERSLDHDPRTLFEGIDRQRSTIHALALDDVGADVRAMSLLPAVRPDVIKLDLNVTQGAPSREAMKVLHSVYEEVERTAATILAEGVETRQHHEVARALGAQLAQGWLYGKPTDDPSPAEEHEAHMPLWAELGLKDVQSPFEVLGGQPISRATRNLVRSVADEVFRHALHLLSPGLLLLLVPDSEALPKRHLRIMSQIARAHVMTGVIGAGLPPEPAPGVRGSQPHDPALDGQYAIIAVSPSAAVAVLARRAHLTHDDFYFGIIHDRPRITTAARCLLRQLGAQPASG
jgi:EAL domain-containing protein (putative c-di-GMP-specific phosphodiesterase class I)